jgi:hypothetical protein
MSDKGLERSLSLVHSLYNRTQAGKIDWQPSSDFADAFEARFGELRVAIRLTPDPEYPENPDYVVYVVKDPVESSTATRVVLRPSAPQVIDEISNTTLRPLMDRTTGDGLNPYEVLRETFKMASRKALGVDEVLDELLEKLNEE